MALGKIRTIKVGDEAFKAVEMRFDTVNERWSEYHLPNGMVVHVKNVVTDIYLLVNDEGEPVYDDNGEPRIVVQSSVDTVASEALEIDPEQRWFWTEEWQAKEREVDDDLAQGRYEVFDNFEDFIDSL